MSSDNRSNTGKIIRIIALVAVGGCAMLALCIGGFVYVIIRLTQPIADVGSDFLLEIGNENYNSAYILLSDGLQSEFGSVEAFGAAMQERNIDPERWTFSSRSVNNSSGSLGSTVVMTDGSEQDVSINLEYRGELWLITGFSFEPPGS
jgi:hypothetical protein